MTLQYSIQSALQFTLIGVGMAPLLYGDGDSTVVVLNTSNQSSASGVPPTTSVNGDDRDESKLLEMLSVPSVQLYTLCHGLNVEVLERLQQRLMSLPDASNVNDCIDAIEVEMLERGFAESRDLYYNEDGEDESHYSDENDDPGANNTLEQQGSHLDVPDSDDDIGYLRAFAILMTIP